MLLRINGSVDIPLEAGGGCCSPRLQTRTFSLRLATKPSSRSDRDELQLPRHRTNEKRGILQGCQRSQDQSTPA
jgi:hypothetical protein